MRTDSTPGWTVVVNHRTQVELPDAPMPPDGKDVLIVWAQSHGYDGTMRVAYRDEGEWVLPDGTPLRGVMPSHWQDLPCPPVRILEDLTISHVEILEAARSILGDRGQDTENLSVAIGSLDGGPA